MPYDVDIGDGADALGQNQLSDALDGTYWVSGWEATLGTGDLEVDIAAGDGAVDGTDVSTASTQTIDFTGDPDATDPRKAVIYVDSGGTVQKSLGTPQPVDPSGEIRFRTYNPSPPASVAGVVVAEVWLAAGETVLESADLRDRRVSNQAANDATPNKPDWVEDGNSPSTFSGVSSTTYTLASEYDEVKVKLFLTGDFSSLGSVEARVNGDSGSNYDSIEADGTVVVESSFLVGVLRGGPSRKEFTLDGKWASNAKIGFFNQSGEYAAVVHRYGRNTSVTSPLNSIEILTSNTITGRIEVFGRNIG